MTLTLRPYQEAGAAFLRSVWAWPEGVPRTALLCDEMGLGKTPQATMAIPGPMHDEPEVGTLVIAPAGLSTVWARHVRDWRPDLRATVIRKTKDLRAPHFGEVAIVSPDALGWAARGRGGHSGIHAKAALARLSAGLRAGTWQTLVIIDEAHTIKGGKAKRAQACGDLIRPCVARGATCWALTATPTPRSAEDIWCLLHRMGADSHPLAFGGKGIAGWAAWAKATRNRSGWKCAETPASPLDHADALGGLLLRRLVKDHLPEIPAPVHAIRFVPISGELTAEADEILRQACKSIGVPHSRIERHDLEGADDVDDALLRTISQTANRGMLSTISAKLAEAKAPHVLAELQRLIDDGEPAVVYSEHKHTIEQMKKLGHPVVMGGMSERQKSNAVDLFQDGHAQALGFTGAGRQGITLTRASHFLEADPNWSADDRAQALGRVIRFGREGEATVIHFLADHPLERLRMRVLRRKRAFTLAALGSSM